MTFWQPDKMKPYVDTNMEKNLLKGTVIKRCGMSESDRMSQRESERAKVSKSESGLFAKMLFVNAL